MSDLPTRQINQHYQAVPDDILQPLVVKYHTLGFGDKKILAAISQELDLASHGWTLSTKTIQRRRREWGLLSVKQQGHTLETIAPYVEKARVHSNNRLGAKSMRDHLREDSVLVSRELIQQYLRLADPVGNQQRRANRLVRQIHWTTGLHEVWSMDQHDKWRRFGLFLHVGMENFSNAVLWLRCWWTNSNPRLIASFFLQAARQQGGIPLLTQSDPGSENHGVANAQTTLRRTLDPTLEGTLQHRWMRGHMNIKPEIFWSKLRRQWSDGWETLFQEGLIEGWYDPHDQLELLLFRWLAVPMLQQDLDRFARIHNHSKPRKDRKKRMPAEIPCMLMEHPEDYGPFCDYKIAVSPEQLTQAAQIFAPPEHEVFQLVPPEFQKHVEGLYHGLHRPPITRETFWQVYGALLDALQHMPESDVNDLEAATGLNKMREATIQHEYVDVLPGQAARGPAWVGAHGAYDLADAARMATASSEPDDDMFSSEGDPHELPAFTVTVVS